MTHKAGISFPKSFVRQLDDYSCGPAALATVARLFGVDRDYLFFRDLMNLCTQTGSKPETLAEGAQAHLPCTGHGEYSYERGVAIANIIHVADGIEEGHYVVFLDRQDDEFIYYDPYDHQLVRIARADLRWVSGFPPIVHEWSVNFGPVEGMEFDDWLALL